MNTNALRAATLALQPGDTSMHSLSEFIPWKEAQAVDVVLDRSLSGKLQVIINSSRVGMRPVEDMLLERALRGSKTTLRLVARK